MGARAQIPPTTRAAQGDDTLARARPAGRQACRLAADRASSWPGFYAPVRPNRRRTGPKLDQALALDRAVRAGVERRHRHAPRAPARVRRAGGPPADPRMGRGSFAAASASREAARAAPRTWARGADLRLLFRIFCCG